MFDAKHRAMIADSDTHSPNHVLQDPLGSHCVTCTEKQLRTSPGLDPLYD